VQCFRLITAKVAGEEQQVSGEEQQQQQRVQIECYSCKVISDAMCFVLPGYLLYHTYKNRPQLKRSQRVRLYLANGILAACK